MKAENEHPDTKTSDKFMIGTVKKKIVFTNPSVTSPLHILI
jgi:hypothetical protein